MTECAVFESRPVVGSSKKRQLGDVIISMAIDVRFLSPPEIPRLNAVPTCVREKFHLVCTQMSLNR